MNWVAARVAILPCPPLGDNTLYLRLAWRFHQAGAQVTLYSSTLYPARQHIPHLQLEPAPDLNFDKFSQSYDLVISDLFWLLQAQHRGGEVPQAANIAFTSAKKLPRHFSLGKREVIVNGQSLGFAHQAMRKANGSGEHMVYWIDHYAAHVFNLDCKVETPQLINFAPRDADAARRIALFPTTPSEAKNYHLAGFRRLADRLHRQGWLVEFVCTPGERGALQDRLPGYAVLAFADIAELMCYLAGCAVVISNDSGGGHLGSLLGLRTFTVTRRDPLFNWRPGFNAHNQVISPLFTFKWFGRVVWRPFVPVSRIATRLGAAP